MEMLEILEKLCNTDGISGRENHVREYVISQLPQWTDYSVDKIGNLIVNVKGRKDSKNKVMLSAHMDEVGFIVTYITDTGFLKCACVGGINEKVIAGRVLKLCDTDNFAIAGIKPVHLCSDEEKKTAPSIEQLYFDVGAKTKEEAEKITHIGDALTFASDFVRFGDGRIKSKAIDDRFGCAVLLKLIKERPEYDLTCTFVVQEEVGLRGAGAAAFAVEPDYAIVVEATTACDISGVYDENRVCSLGGGAVVSYMDGRTVYDMDLYRLAFEKAEKNGIKCQTKTAVAGGNDAGVIHKSRCGVRTAAISLPCRYIHSAGCVADINDMNDVYQLVKILCEECADA